MIDTRTRTDAEHMAAAARTRRAHLWADLLQRSGHSSVSAAVSFAADAERIARLVGRPAPDRATWDCAVRLLSLREQGLV